MRPVLRRDAEGWSPVFIALLLLFLAMLILSLFAPPTFRALGVVVTRSSDGTNWTLTLTSVPTGLTQNATTLTLMASNGVTVLNATSMYELEGAGMNGVGYVPVAWGPSDTVCSPGDQILISVARYPTGTQAMIVNAGSVLFSATLQ